MRKPKLTQAEIEAQREEKINATFTKFSVQLRQLEKQKQFLVGKVVEAKKKGLKNEELKARTLLGKNLSQTKRTEGMQMQLELLLQDRNLSNLQQSFMECMGDISSEIEGNVDKKTAKKTKKNYLKALFNINEQNKRTDDLLDAGEAAFEYQANDGQYSKFDDEIDSLITEEELKGYSDPSKMRY